MSHSQLAKTLESFPSRRIAVLGDMMLDVYLWGKVSRMSPEAPVPVVNVHSRTSCPGGAANVMRNVATLKAAALAFGAVGEDAVGGELIESLSGLGVGIDGICRDHARRTTEKRRVLSGSQQLCRVDFEDTFPLDEKLRDRMTDEICALMAGGKLDAVIFEDYRKGVLDSRMVQRIVDEARRCGVATALDPKPGSIAPVRGLTAMKPNRGEAFALAHMSDSGESGGDPGNDAPLREAARRIMEEWRPENLLISLAAQGMALFGSDGRMVIIPTRAREVFDVSGAGDTVTATFTLALVSGASPAQAAELANLAAGVVVGKIGTVPITYDELKKELESRK